ncbi:MAG: phosphate-starvation-inducible PsiE family protein [Eubacteriales bacterium]|nr:phosphate-starvation-inducible PsiE family protein [Eubacteriales bacterium]
MRKHVINILSKVANVLEFCITIMLIIGIALLCLRLAGSLIHVPGAEAFPEYDELLETCFNLIIGVELIRMMYYHSADTVFELLIFAIARQVIIDHSSAIANLIGACAIAVLFATRKFLFLSHKPTEPMSEPLSDHEDKI